MPKRDQGGAHSERQGDGCEPDRCREGSDAAGRSGSSSPVGLAAPADGLPSQVQTEGGRSLYRESTSFRYHREDEKYTLARRFGTLVALQRKSAVRDPEMHADRRPTDVPAANPFAGMSAEGSPLDRGFLAAGRQQCSYRRQPGGRDSEPRFLVPANVLPPDEPAHCEALSRAPDLGGPLPERIPELGQARFAIEQSEQHSQLRGRTVGSLEQLEHAIESGPPGPGDRSVSGAIVRDALQLEVRATDRKLNHAPIVDASRGNNNGCQPAFGRQRCAARPIGGRLRVRA